MTEAKQIIDLIYIAVLIVVAIGGFFGGSVYFSRKVNRNFDEKYQADKEERAEAKKQSDEKEEARMQVIISLQESFVAVGHVAQRTAEAHLKKCGPDANIKEALDVYATVRAKADAQTRQEAAKYREARQGT